VKKLGRKICSQRAKIMSVQREYFNANSNCYCTFEKLIENVLTIACYSHPFVRTKDLAKNLLDLANQLGLNLTSVQIVQIIYDKLNFHKINGKFRVISITDFDGEISSIFEGPYFLYVNEA
jgi:hypothetical protein